MAHIEVVMRDVKTGFSEAVGDLDGFPSMKDGACTLAAWEAVMERLSDALHDAQADFVGPGARQ